MKQLTSLIDSMRKYNHIQKAVPHIKVTLADFKPISDEKVLEILKTLKPKSQCELDLIPTPSLH